MRLRQHRTVAAVIFFSRMFLLLNIYSSVFLIPSVVCSNHFFVTVHNIVIKKWTFSLIYYLFVVIIQEDGEITEMSQASDAMMRGRSLDSIPSTFTNGSSSPGPNSECYISYVCFRCLYVWKYIIIVYTNYINFITKNCIIFYRIYHFKLRY